MAEMAVGDLCAKYGASTVKACLEIMLDSAEENMRQRISEMPDGDYHYEQYMDNGGLSPEPLPLKTKLTIKGDSMTFDFTGSAKMDPGPMNCGLPVTQGGVFVIIKSWLDPKTPINGGDFRPVEFIIPEGSCLAATLPTAVGGCWQIYWQLESSVIGLFAQVMPHEPAGEHYVGADHVYIGGYDGWWYTSWLLPGEDDGAVAYHSAGAVNYTASTSSMCKSPKYTNHYAAWTCTGYNKDHYGMKTKFISKIGW